MPLESPGLYHRWRDRDRVDENTVTLTTTGETTLLAAAGVGIFHDLSMLILSNNSATMTRVDFRDATGGPIRFSVNLAASGGGAVIVPVAPIKQTAANTDWTAQLSAATDVRIFVQGVRTK